MRHNPGLAARVPVRDILIVARSEVLSSSPLHSNIIESVAIPAAARTGSVIAGMKCDSPMPIAEVLAN